ncbi:conserved hypothetical protein [uncultured Defluviicoccus sp.]|uniref:Uncharacterized protein n=1 Tax=metagenome TaxID=256318 RepID=A0A380TG30_9ZZZZ|nr:conserved hypothetical protein [uncultured Defluviicoccus sp.]
MRSRQLNVQQQVALVREGVEGIADFATKADSPVPWLAGLLREMHIDPATGVLVKLQHIPDQGGEYYSGLWLAAPAQFWEFEVTIPRLPSQTRVVEHFAPVDVPVLPRARGKGTSFGAIALSVLNARVAS